MTDITTYRYCGQPTTSELPMSEPTGQVWNRMMERAMSEVKANPPKPGETVVIQMRDGPRDDTAHHSERMVADWRRTAFLAIGKEVEDLSDREKFCIAFCAGVDIESFYPPIDPNAPAPVPAIHWRTKSKVGLVKKPDGFGVYLL